MTFSKHGKCGTCFQLELSGPICHCLDLLWVSPYLPTLNDVSQKTEGMGVELTLLGFHIELVLQESLENLTDMGDMVGHILGKNKNVIQVNKNKTSEEIF